MAELPVGRHRVRVGKSLAAGGVSSLHAVRFDFKPAEDSGGESSSFIAHGENKEVAIGVPRGEADLDLYKGAQKDASEKDAVLLFDPASRSFRLERLATNSHLKKTRNDDNSQAMLNAIQTIRKTNLHTHASTTQDSSSSSSNSDSDSEPELDDVKPLSPSAKVALHVTRQDSSQAGTQVPTARQQHSRRRSQA